MKITSIETIALRDETDEGYTVVRVHTDEGITGIGQAESPSLVIDAIIRNSSGLEALIKGEDPPRAPSANMFTGCPRRGAPPFLTG